MVDQFEKILYQYETSLATQSYQLTREEFLYVHFFSEGKVDVEIGEYLNRKKSYLYNLRKNIIAKFRVNSFAQVMFAYGKLA